MNSQTKIRLQIFITQLEVMLTRVAPDHKSEEYVQFREAAEELKQQLDKDETILEVR